MKYIIECSKRETEDEYHEDFELPVELCLDGGRKNTSLIFDFGKGKEIWIPLSELDHLIFIIDELTKGEL